MPGTKRQALNDAKKLRDVEFKTYDAEIKKWNDFYAKWKKLVAANDPAGAKALQPKLDAQSKAVDRARLAVEGKMEAIDQLLGAATLAAARKGIDRIISREANRLFVVLVPRFLKLFGGTQELAKGQQGVAEQIYFILLRLKGKGEIREIVAKELAKA